MTNDLTRPIIGIENRTAQEVFDIMCSRFTAYLSALGEREPVAADLERAQPVQAHIHLPWARCHERGTAGGNS